MSHSVYLLTVLAGGLVFDASHFPADPGWTVGVVRARVLAGTLTVLVPPGVEVVTDVRLLAGGRLSSTVGADRARAHLLLSGTVLFGRIRVERVAPGA